MTQLAIGMRAAQPRLAADETSLPLGFAAEAWYWADLMSTENLSLNGRHVSVAGRAWSAEYDIADGRIVADRVLLLYDYMTGPRHQQFKNLEAFDFEGRRLWTAQHPTSETADAYVAFVTERPLTVSNFAGYLCEIDPATGELLRQNFTK